MGRAKDEFIRLQETPIMETCAECQGTGTVDVEVARPQSFSRDIGELDIEEETCEDCAGSGELERLCDCGEWVTLIMGDDATICEECANE
jgi:DnaJ-class molecular chaperone